MRQYTQQFLMLDTDTTDAVSSMMSMRNYKCAKISVVITEGFDGLLKFFGTDQETKPDLNEASSDTNQYSPQSILDMDGLATIAGSTGVQFGTAPYVSAGVYTFEAQSDDLAALGCTVSDATDGTIKVYVKFSNDVE